MMQRVVISEVDQVLEAKWKTKHGQVAGGALMATSENGYGAASASLKDISCQYIENVFTEMNLKNTMDNLSIKSPKRRSQSPACMNAFTKRVLNSRTSTNLTATFGKNRMDNIMKWLRLTAKDVSHHTFTTVGNMVPLSPTE